jgi:hypothetical protein
VANMSGLHDGRLGMGVREGREVKADKAAAAMGCASRHASTTGDSEKTKGSHAFACEPSNLW